ISSGPGDQIHHPQAYLSSEESHDLMFSPRLTLWSSPQPVMSSGRRKLAYLLLALACPNTPEKSVWG
ncbi:unnamed protein product, partial [Ectocarpus sp. 6 AP-2014]